MTSHDDDFLDLVAVLALGALPEAEARAVAAHMRTCEGCRALYAELRPAADLVGYASEAPRALDEIASARLKARVMGAVREQAAADRGGGSGSRGVRRGTSYPAWFAAAAAAIIAVLVGADDLQFRARTDRISSALHSHDAGLATAKRVSDERLIALLAPGSKHFAIPQGEVVTNGVRVFIAMKLPAAPSGKIYQAWTLAKGAKAVAPSITFAPSSNGVAVVELPVHADALAAVAVSVEPAGGSKAPTSTPKFIRKLS